MQARIPVHTLHKEIHRKMNSIPVPSPEVCEYVWHELEYLRIARLINAELDGLEQKLGVLIQILSEYKEDNLEATIATLKWQKQIVHKFYQSPSS